MLKQVRSFFKGLSMDKAEIAKEIKKNSSTEELRTYRIWLFCLNVVVCGVMSLLFIPGAPYFMYSMYMSFKWMKAGNTTTKKD